MHTISNSTFKPLPFAEQTGDAFLLAVHAESGTYVAFRLPEEDCPMEIYGKNKDTVVSAAVTAWHDYLISQPEQRLLPLWDHNTRTVLWQ